MPLRDISEILKKYPTFIFFTCENLIFVRSARHLSGFFREKKNTRMGRPNPCPAPNLSGTTWTPLDPTGPKKLIRIQI